MTPRVVRVRLRQLIPGMSSRSRRLGLETVSTLEAHKGLGIGLGPLDLVYTSLPG